MSCLTRESVAQLIPEAPLFSSNPIKSPLRYPGGKGSFFPYFAELLKQNSLEGADYFEPFAGGAGIAISLLSSDLINSATLNDADYHIYSLWMSILNENERFREGIISTDLSVAEWKRQREIYRAPTKFSIFEVGFSAFYLNRCNRSGILSRASLIGGLKQAGEWRMDARFNREELESRVASIGRLRERIKVHNLDAILFLKSMPQKGVHRTFAYIDPPYVSAGNRLYLNFYKEKDHKDLADYLVNRNKAGAGWIVTYDDSPFIRGLYASCQRQLFYLGYSLQSKQKGQELLIAPSWLRLPKTEMFSSQRWGLLKKLRRAHQ